MKVWELTQKEYIDYREQGGTPKQKRDLKPHSIYLHREAIIKAMNRGISIHSKVLKSYPELQLSQLQKRAFRKLLKLKGEWYTANKLNESSKTLNSLTRKGLARKRSARETGWKEMEYRVGFGV